jgi:hypothetical protein
MFLHQCRLERTPANSNGMQDLTSFDSDDNLTLPGVQLRACLSSKTNSSIRDPCAVLTASLVAETYTARVDDVRSTQCPALKKLHVKQPTAIRSGETDRSNFPSGMIRHQLHRLTHRAMW